MRRLIERIATMFPKPVQKPVGRWSVGDCAVKQNTKIDRANEDHCGPCGRTPVTDAGNGRRNAVAGIQTI